MLVTLDWMRKNYNKFNRLYWSNKLPDIDFKITNSKHTWGYARYTIDRVNKTIFPLDIWMSNYYDSPESVKQSTLLHEMIHIAEYTFFPERYYNRRYNCHGPWFISEAKRLSKHGWNIDAIVTDEETSQSTITKANQIKMDKKIKEAVLCVTYCGSCIWYFKTNISNITKFKNVVLKYKDSCWNKNYGGLKKISFFTFKDDELASNRSCISRPCGWNISYDKFDDMVKEKHMKEMFDYRYVC